MSAHISFAIVAGWAFGMLSMTGTHTSVTDLKRGGNPMIEFLSLPEHHAPVIAGVTFFYVSLAFTGVMSFHVLIFGHICPSNISCLY